MARALRPRQLLRRGFRQVPIPRSTTASSARRKPRTRWWISCYGAADDGPLGRSEKSNWRLHGATAPRYRHCEHRPRRRQPCTGAAIVPQGGLAPLEKNLAAALLLRADWPGMAARGGAMIDPPCSSGTLLIEGAMMAMDIAPGRAPALGIRALAAARRQIVERDQGRRGAAR